MSSPLDRGRTTRSGALRRGLRLFDSGERAAAFAQFREAVATSRSPAVLGKCAELAPRLGVASDQADATAAAIMTTAPDQKITACIVCRNEADKLGACLESIAWVDEIIVMDLDSSDRSAAVARAGGATVLEHAVVTIVEFVRNEVAAKAQHDWILVLDPDERLAPALEARLREVACDDSCDAVVIPRTNFDFGHAPSHWTQRYEPQLRMYRRSRVAWPEVPNALPKVPEERIRRLPHEDDLVIVHQRSRNISEVLDRSIRYAPAQARSMVEAGTEFSAAAMLRALWRETDRKLFGTQAWRDGLPGLIRAGVLISFKFHVWVEFWQQSGGQRTAADDRIVRRLGWILEPLRLAGGLGKRIKSLAVGRRRRQ